MVKFWAGALGGMLLFASGIAHAERPKILVLPVTGKTADAGFRQRVGQALSEGLFASGGEVVALPTGAAALPPEGCTTPACLAGAARATGAAFLLRAVVDEEGRSYEFKLEMLDGQSGAVLAQRENRCEICTDSEALEIANASASALKAQALKRPAGTTAAGPPAASVGVAIGDRASGPRARVTVLDRLELPASLGEFHAKLRTSLEALVREQGLEVIDAPAVSANCRSTSCEEDRLTASGASHVLFIEGSRNDYGFSLDITLRGIAGEDTEKAQGWCNFCTGPQMVTAAENVARPLGRPPRGPPRTRPGWRGRRARCIDRSGRRGQRRLRPGARASRRGRGRGRRGGDRRRQLHVAPRGHRDRLLHDVDWAGTNAPRRTRARISASEWWSAALFSPASAGT